MSTINRKLYATLLSLSGVMLLICTSSGYADAIPDSQGVLIKITDQGAAPNIVELDRLDAQVFLFNDTTNSNIKIDIDFKGKRTHCSSPNMRLNEQGHMISTESLEPKDFAAMCFPESGEYPVKISGLKGKKVNTESKIVVKGG